MRLDNLEKRSSLSKTKLMCSIADDMCATFQCIAKHAEAGNLTARHTEPLDQVIRIIRDTEVSQRHRLERQARRLRLERRWMRREFRKVVKSAEQVSQAWEKRVAVLQGTVRELHYEVARVKVRGEAEDVKELDSCEEQGDEVKPLRDDANGDYGEE